MTCSHGRTVEDECCDCDRRYYGIHCGRLEGVDLEIHYGRLARVLASPCDGSEHVATVSLDWNEGHGPEPDAFDGHYDEGGY